MSLANPLISNSVIPSPLLAADLADKAKPKQLIGPFGSDSLTVAFNQFIFMGVVAATLAFLFLWMASRSIRTTDTSVEGHITKGRMSQLFEAILLFLRDTVTRPHLGHLTDKYIPYVWTTFFLILFANLLGLMPIGQTFALVSAGLGSEEHYTFWQYFGGPAMANISVTAALATISLFMIIYVGIKEGGSHFFAHFAPIPLWPIMDGGKPVMLLVAVPLVLLEIVGLFIKAGVLALRLFGNILAGFLVIAALVQMIIDFQSLPIAIGVTLGATAIMFLELFIAFLQTFIFTFLTVLFIASGAHVHDEHDEMHDYDKDYEGEPVHGLVSVPGKDTPPLTPA
ncbi:MAG: F0F1 ATP synthase subunit A [Planctomycetota bacterium]